MFVGEGNGLAVSPCFTFSISAALLHQLVIGDGGLLPWPRRVRLAAPPKVPNGDVVATVGGEQSRALVKGSGYF